MMDELDEIIERITRLNKEVEKRTASIYARMAGHPAVEKLVSTCALSPETSYVIEVIEKIDDLFAQGKTYTDIFSVVATVDDNTGNLAFLIHAEAQFQTNITSYKQLQELTQLQQNEDDVKNSYHMGAEHRLWLVLDKILREGGKYKDLVALNPGDFGLPDQWEGMFNKLTTKDDVIIQVLASFIDDEMNNLLGPSSSLTEITEKIQAPLQKIIKASSLYSD